MLCGGWPAFATSPAFSRDLAPTVTGHSCSSIYPTNCTKLYLAGPRCPFLPIPQSHVMHPHPFPSKPVGQPGPQIPPSRQILHDSALRTRRADSFVAVSSLSDDTSAAAKCNQAVVVGAIKFSTASHRLVFSGVDRSERISACFVAETEVNLASCGLSRPRLQAKMRRFSAPRQHRGQIAAYRHYLFPSYRTKTHPLVERVPLVGTQLGQGQSGRLRLPQWTPGFSKYSCGRQRGRAGYEDGQ